jgi:hypothetical protein
MLVSAGPCPPKLANQPRNVNQRFLTPFPRSFSAFDTFSAFISAKKMNAPAVPVRPTARRGDLAKNAAR